MNFTRFALFYVPRPDAPWVRFATQWLGWDIETGLAAAQPDLATLGDMTKTPRKYGLHATIKPPFRLAEGADFGQLQIACEALCRGLKPVSIGQLHITPLGRFLGLCPAGVPALTDLAHQCVQHLDPFRADPNVQELARRRAAHLSPRQKTNLATWGYPYVGDDFRFHITLTSRLQKPDLKTATAILEASLAPLLPINLVLNDLALVGEDSHKQFHLIRRFDLTG